MYTTSPSEAPAPPPAGGFPRAEHEGRLAALRAAMARRGLDLCLLSSPESVCYLTGLDHWGYFAPHLLLVPPEGEPALVTRAMERVTVANQVRVARFAGHDDHETAADGALRVVGEAGWRARRVGIEAWSSGLPHGLATALKAGLPGALWSDVGGLVDDLRLVKSPAEQAALRAAARVSDAAMAAAVAAIAEGATEREVAAACSAALVAAGGTFPGFGPFVRSTARLGEEHTSWGDARLGAGDAVFLELSGCVARYHAPLGRLVHVGRVPPGARAMAGLCAEAFAAVLDALRDGTTAGAVYAAWQGVVDRAGLARYRRHHCGYAVGLGVPPSWTGGNRVTGLRPGSDLVIRTGMSFHVLSWLMGTGRGDFFISNTVLLGAGGPEVLTLAPAGPTLR